MKTAATAAKPNSTKHHKDRWEYLGDTVDHPIGNKNNISASTFRQSMSQMWSLIPSSTSPARHERQSDQEHPAAGRD